MDISTVMTPDPIVCSADTELEEVARIMRDQQVGDVIVDDGNELCGLVTDRDIVVAALANGSDLAGVTLGEICSEELHTISLDAPIDELIALMESRVIRRVPVLQGGKAVGIVSIGDLAERLDRASLLGKISAAPPDRP